MKVLIVEDEPDVAKTIKMFLEQNGYSADYSLEPMDAVKKLPEYDLLLLDLIMPEMSGHTVLKEMKAKKIDKPVVVLSAVSMPKTIGPELENEYQWIIFVPKTRMHSDLIPAIKKALGQ